MAFCNSCGTNIGPGARFCPKCGGAVPAAVVGQAATQAAPAAPGTSSQNNALKIILIVVAVIVVLGVVGVGSLVFVVRRIAHRSHIENRDGNVRVETPMGTIQSTNDPEEASRNLGIDLYPGAKVIKGTSSTFGGMHTVEAEFESDDPPDKVSTFYSSKFPHANVTTKDQDRYTIVSTDNKNLITINIEPDGSKTRIKIANVSGKNVTGDNSSD